MKNLTFAVVGSGSVGLYYGGKLAAGGAEVRFLLRSGYDEASRDGIRIHSPQSGDVVLSQPSIFRRVEEIGPVDVVILSIKSTANDALDQLLPPLLGPDTAILTLQNGLGGDEGLAQRFGSERILGGLCFICLTRRTAASVDHIGRGLVTIGEFGRSSQSRTHAIVQALNAGGAEARVVEHLAEERWRKLVWNVPFNGLSVAAGGVTVDRILSDPALHAECRALMQEIIASANALGFPIEESYADFQIERTYAMGAYRPSTLVDWEAGQELEIEPIWGEPLRRAQQAGIATPQLAALTETLRRTATR